MAGGLIVPQIPILIQDEHLVEDTLQVIRALRPKWIEEREKNGVDIQIKTFSNGITNKLFGVQLATAAPNEMVMIKVYGEKTDLLIDREAEIVTLTLLHMKKIGAQLYALFENGICYEFLPGVVMSMEACRSSDIYPLTAAEMARLHKSIPRPQNVGGNKCKSEIWKKLRSFLAINVDLLGENPSLSNKLEKEIGYNVETLTLEIEELESILESQGMPVVFCHNDTALNNVIYHQEENYVKFIDFEYALFNYGPYDVANHFMEYAGLHDPDYSLCPKREFRSAWITHYLKVYGTEDFTQEQFERWVELCIPLSDLYWALWCVIQEEISTIQFDFIGYAGARYAKFKHHMIDIRAGKYQPE